ncbi:hypothetical protein [Anaerocolumna xylanovorans]|uniref:ABC-2 family transporter protein n=1 Tax=Anaerocolumna xylanovorans DSM 12503 TaxID=1121345 RepID=A0A1M7Y0B4_9FIRM|nr:hypothetical protein [Anaerocolumna xylanovorans]SHO45009.1 hypothetical protein SAMN02745217_00797 [Anaerocolumna xylanovorans DSM 12503]
MLKLMKYELRKQAFSKLIIIIIAALGEAVFFSGLLLDKHDTMGLAIGLLTIFTMGAMFFIAFESIITYYNDLKQKQSYMLFLTPHTPYTIVGAKVLSSGIQIILSGLVFGLIFAVDGAALLAKYSSINEIKDFLHELLSVQFHIDVDGKLLVLAVLALLISWISTITLAYLSITLSTTFLANKRGKALISFIIFLILEYIFSKISDIVTSMPAIPQGPDFTIIISIVLYTVLTAITYLATAWMLDKKVSV